MTVRTIRDWRGIKHPLSKCSDDELVAMLQNAELTQANVSAFAARVAAEMGRRGLSGDAPAHRFGRPGE
jgi:hypothetical protein